MSLCRKYLALLGVAGLIATPAAAQVRLTGRLGATISTPMVAGQLGGTNMVGSGVAPTVALEATIPLGARSPVDGSLEVQATSAHLRSADGSTTTEVATMQTITVTAGLAADVMGSLRWRAGAGLISYTTTDRASVFQDGTPTRLLGTVSLEYQHAFFSGYRISGLLRYDVHGYSTLALRNTGRATQIVHRVTLGIGISR